MLHEWFFSNWEIVFVLALTVVALALFVTELVPTEITALGVLVAIGFSGILDTAEVFSGFSNPATLTVLMMFILSAAVLHSGIVDWLCDRLGFLMGKSTFRQVLVVGLVAGPVSAFINNTAAVAVLIPVVVRLANAAGRSPSKLLMPLSFAAMLGGTMTLIGTSTNLLGSGLRAEAGFGPFGMFEFTLAGMIVFGVGLAYLAIVGHFFVPARIVPKAIDERYHLREFVFEVEVPEESSVLGKRVGEAELATEYDAEIIQVKRSGRVLDPDRQEVEYKPKDRLVVRTTRTNLQRMADTGIVEIVPASKAPTEDLETLQFAELLVHANSTVRRHRLGSVGAWREWGVHPVALLRRGKSEVADLKNHVLSTGDIVLVAGEKRDTESLTGGDEFYVLGGPTVPVTRPQKAPFVLVTLALVVAIAAIGWFPIVLTATAGVVVLVAARVVKPLEMYRSINWDIIFLLAGIIPLGLAVQASGAASMLAGYLARSGDYLAPLYVLALVYFVTTILTELVSNNAAVVLVVPVSIELALQLGFSPTPFILAPMFAASTSFLSPIGYQTNLMVMGPGGYRYSDYIRIGGPLNILMLIVTPITLNHFFPILG